MLLRSLTKHVKDQNWFAVGIDFLIVVFGVFIGLQVANWNDHRQNHAIAEDYLERLESDLRDEISQWEYTQDYYGTVRRHGIEALDGLRQDSEPLDAQFLIDLYQASQKLNVAVPKGTYDELLATGRIIYITDDNIRRSLNNHYDRARGRILTFQDQGDYRQTLRERMDDRVQATIRENCDDIYTVDENNNTSISLPESCEISLPQDLLSAEIEKLRADDIIQRTLRFQISILDSRMASLKSAIETSTNTLSDIEEASS